VPVHFGSSILRHGGVNGGTFYLNRKPARGNNAGMLRYMGDENGVGVKVAAESKL
jgi:hypothetical protein